MARQFIFKDTETGRELVLPVTPGSYDIEHGRKAAANGIANPNLIHPGQVLRLPAREELPAAATPSRSQQVAAATGTSYDSAQKKWKIQLSKEEAMGF